MSAVIEFSGLLPERPSTLWRRYTQVALLLFLPLAIIFARTHADLAVAHALFFDPSRNHWIGADSWVTNGLIHHGGQWLLRILAAAALGTWITTFFRPGMRALRRPAGYFALSLIFSVGTVGLLKLFTNVHCPWDLREFGADLPYVELFAHRVAGTAGHCFPAAHASSGYALFAFYFLFRERSHWLSRLGLITGVCMGLIFGIAQQSRGAHFVSHDLWSAFLVWMISMTIYTTVFKARLWDWNTVPRFSSASHPSTRNPQAGARRPPAFSAALERSTGD